MCKAALLLLAAGPACGPGGFASDGSESFGSADSGTGDSDPATASASASSTSTPTTVTTTSETEGPAETGDTDTGETSETGETDPSTTTWGEPDMPEDPGPPPGAMECGRTWVSLDNTDTHGHIGETPLAGIPEGGLLTINPLLGDVNDPTNANAWFRRWSAGDGELQWANLIDWAPNRDDPESIAFDEFGAIYVGGRHNANQFSEQAMIARLSAEAEPDWLMVHGDLGSYARIAYADGVIVAAGEIGSLGGGVLELVIVDPDTGEVLATHTPEIGLELITVEGLLVRNGRLALLVAAVGGGVIELLRFDLPSFEPEPPIVLTEFGGLAHDLAFFGSSRVAALYDADGGSRLAIVDPATAAIELDLGLGTDIAFPPFGAEAAFTELATTATGLALGGDTWQGVEDTETFVAHLDEELELVCTARIGADEIEGLNHSLELRALSVGSEGELYTGSWPLSRNSVFVRWD